MSGDVLLDRDGVLLDGRGDYVLSVEQVRLLPGAGNAVRRLCSAGHRVFVITNQSPVGRGLLTTDELDRIHQRLGALIRAEGGQIEDYFVCPHHPEAGCQCRKPKPGLLYEARERAGVQLGNATVVGDKPTDVAAARSAGCRGVLILSAHSARPVEIGPEVPVVADLGAAADLILDSR
jgi:D-glycero-D-manno-heptose 1,7-bisphosphate phosphatase